MSDRKHATGVELRAAAVLVAAGLPWADAAIYDAPLAGSPGWYRRTMIVRVYREPGEVEEPEAEPPSRLRDLWWKLRRGRSGS